MSIVVITGCSSGIGRATALAFARRGDRVYAAMRDPAKGMELANAAGRERLPIRTVELDVTDDTSVERSVRSVLEREGRIDVLVNNAGVLRLGSVELLADELVHAIFETNLFGTVRMVRAVLPSMRARGAGAIVNVSSLAGRVPTLPINGFYAATKHAVSVLSDALALELEPFGIRVACIEPGFVRSEIVRNAGRPASAGSPYRVLEEAVFEVMERGVAEGIDPDAVADATVAAARAPIGDPVHVLVGDDAEQYVEAYRSVSELEYTALVRDYVGLEQPCPTGGRP